MFLDKRASQRSKDENGYLIVKNNPIAKAGVFEYLHSELFEDSKDDTIVKVYRDFDSLKSVKDTFANKPIMHNHQWVGEEADQVDGAIGSVITVDEDNQMLRADLIFYNPKLIQAIESGEDIELSPGYTGEIEEQKGRFDGQSYDYTQLTDYCNHLAVVRNGRAGKDLKIQDSKIKTTEEDMNKEEKKRLLDSLKKVLGFKDEEATVTVEDKDTKEKTEDKGKKEEPKKTMDSELSEIINIARNEDMSEEDKLKAIKSLIGSGDPAKTETKDEDVTEEEKKDDMDADYDDKAEEIGEMIEKVIESKMAKFKDKSAKESKKILDTYTKVSDALGTNFNYNGMTADEILKFGYNALTGEDLADGMDANTAFTMATQTKRGNTFEDAQPDTKEDSKIMKMLEDY